MFACFFNEVKCLSVLQRARRSYSSALVLTNKALQSPEVVARNVTIATVLLLDLFEKFSTGDGYDTAPPMTHLQGAIAIFKLRNGKQFADPTTMSMFRYLSLDLLLNCLKYDTQVPEDFVHLHNQADQYVDANDWEWQFMDLMVRLAQLKATLQMGVSANEASMTLKDLDDEYIRMLQGNSEYLCQDMPEYNFSIAAPSRFPGVCPGAEVLGYTDVFLVRNLLNELLQRNIRCQHDTAA